MARKKQEIALQVELETQEEWEEMLAKEGLTIVDVYQEWCGPCKAMVSQFRRIKNELGDDLLHFAVAKADTIDALEKYRGKCQPCFLFFAGGVLVSVIRGANCPTLTKSIGDQLAAEHKVLDGQAERKEVRDPIVGSLSKDDKAEADDESAEDDEASEEIPAVTMRDASESASRLVTMPTQQKHVKKDVTVAIIKPDVVEAGKVEEIIEKIKECGIEILEQQEKQLTEEEAREFYAHKAEEEFFEDLVKFMTSGPSHVMVLTKGETGEGIIDEWRELLGPASVEEAKEQAPDSLRAQFGKESYVNALHGSDSKETSMRELAFFFPGFTAPSVPGQPGSKTKIQRTLALIRPDALKEKKDEILAKIEESGFRVAMQKEVQLTKEQAQEFYKEHEGESYYDDLTTKMSSGPLLALALAREDAVQGWRDMLGPKELEKAKEEAPQSLRAQFSQEGEAINPLHGSDSRENAQKELDFFFPMQQTVAVIKPDAYQTKDEIMQRIREAGFHIAARKETEVTKDIAEQFYKDHVDKDYFGDLTEHMASGPTLFMVLSREDAVDGWRSLLGPTDPSQAKESAPDTIRAQFGQDIKANAVHGSSTAEHAQESIKLVFGDIEFNEDGTVKGADQAQEEDQQKTDQDEQAEGTEEQKEGGEETQGEEATQEQEAAAAEGEQQAEQTGEQTEDTPAEQQQEQEADQGEAAEEQQQAAEEQQETATEQQEAAAEQQEAAEEPTGEQHETAEEPAAEQQEANEEPATEQQETAEEPAAEQQETDEKPAAEEQQAAKEAGEGAGAEPKEKQEEEKPAEGEEGQAQEEQAPAQTEEASEQQAEGGEEGQKEEQQKEE